MIEAIFAIASIAVGFAMCYFVLWVRNRFDVVEYRINHSGDSRGVRNTNARGEDCDTDEDDVKGSIGFMEAK